MNQNQIAELFDTSVPNISMHISNILKEGELEPNSVVKDYLTTAVPPTATVKKFLIVRGNKTLTFVALKLRYNHEGIPKYNCLNI